jgi:hypothetical protein
LAHPLFAWPPTALSALINDMVRIQQGYQDIDVENGGCLAP